MSDIQKSCSSDEILGAVVRRNEAKEGVGRVKCFECGGPYFRRNCPRAKPVICFLCDKSGHIARNCNNPGNAKNGLVCANSAPRRNSGAVIPRMKISVSGKIVLTLIDTGCTQTLIGPQVPANVAEGSKRIMTADSRLVDCAGEATVDLVMAGKRLTLPCIVLERMIQMLK